MSLYSAALKTYPFIETYKRAGNPTAGLQHREERRSSDDAHIGWEVDLLDGLPQSLPFTSHSYPGKKSAVSAAARFLKRVLNPGTFAAMALVFNTMGASINSATNPFQPVTLRDYMVEIYHQLFCGTHDPNTPINPLIWKSEQRMLVAYARQRMLDYNKAHPEAPQTPTPPSGPAPIAPPIPGQTPIPPCCAGGNLVATLRRQGGKKSSSGTQTSPSLNA